MRFGKQRRKCGGNAGQLASAVGIGARGDGSVPDVRGDEDPYGERFATNQAPVGKKKIRKHLIIISNHTRGFELCRWNFQAFIPKIYMEFVSFYEAGSTILLPQQTRFSLTAGV